MLFEFLRYAFSPLVDEISDEEEAEQLVNEAFGMSQNMFLLFLNIIIIIDFFFIINT